MTFEEAVATVQRQLEKAFEPQLDATILRLIESGATPEEIEGVVEWNEQALREARPRAEQIVRQFFEEHRQS